MWKDIGKYKHFKERCMAQRYSSTLTLSIETGMVLSYVKEGVMRYV